MKTSFRPDRYFSIIVLVVVGLFCSISCSAQISEDVTEMANRSEAMGSSGSSTKDFFSFNVEDLYGKTVSLEQYRGSVVMIVNTASACGYTPQYKDLEKLYQKYKDDGFVVLAFPSNDFGGQEPLEGEEIAQFCSAEYKTTFPIYNKIKVKGKEKHPIYQFLTKDFMFAGPYWNFHKFLVDKNGKVFNHYYTFTTPTSSRIEKAVEKLLNK